MTPSGYVSLGHPDSTVTWNIGQLALTLEMRPGRPARIGAVSVGAARLVEVTFARAPQSVTFRLDGLEDNLGA